MYETTHGGESFCAIGVQTASAASDVPALNRFKQEMNWRSHVNSIPLRKNTASLLKISINACSLRKQYMFVLEPQEIHKPLFSEIQVFLMLEQMVGTFSTSL